MIIIIAEMRGSSDLFWRLPPFLRDDTGGGRGVGAALDGALGGLKDVVGAP